MICRIKIDNQSIKTGCKGMADCLKSRKKPVENRLLELNLDLLKMAYNLLPQNIAGFFKPTGKVQGNKYKDEKTPIRGNSELKPGTMKAAGGDIYNYIARYGMANFQIQVVMRLNGSVDPKILKKAVRLSLNTEPVFGCRFVESQPPYWEPFKELDKVKFCTIVKTDNPEKAVQRFLESPLDMDRDPMLKLKLIKSGSNDILCLKINHTCCDATGVKEYLQLLCNIYSRLDKCEKVPKVKPNIRSWRDQDRLLGALRIRNPEAIRDPMKDVPKTLWIFPWYPGRPEHPSSVVCQLPEGQVDTMSKFAKARGSTINDIIVTALYRAMFEISKPFCGIPMDIPMTVDLRRYLPDQKTEAVRNFSGGFNTRLARLRNEPFEGTLSRVTRMMNGIKKGIPGLQSIVGLEFVESCNFFDTLDYYKKASRIICQNAGCFRLCSPTLSNLGYLDKDLFRFGDSVVTDAYIVPPALCAPGILLCIGTYNDIMTIAVSYYETQVCRAQMEKLLNLIKNELMGAC